MSEFAEFDQLVGNITNLRLQKADAFNDLVVAREGMKVVQYAIDDAIRNNLPIEELSQSLDGYQASFSAYQDAFTQLSTADAEQIGQLFSIYNTQASQVGNLSDQVPILFFPVRLETTFKTLGHNSYELWVRIFPDDIAVETHEPMLTQDEIDQGQAYWTSATGATAVAKAQAWDLLSRSYGAQRAAWVALATKPTVSGSVLNFPTLTPKSDSWTMQPLTRIMPDAFVINCYRTTNHSGPDFSAQTKAIPDEVKLGFDPSNNSSGTFYRSATDIATDSSDGVDWMVDFNAAVASGLGVKIPISADAYQYGFERVIAVGVKVSLTKEASQTRLQNLIDSHHYTDGFSLLKQGTSTNNTETAHSGYSSVDFGNTTTYATEQEANLFTPATTAYNKTDGQLLCEALGIDFDPLYHIFHADGYDIRDAMSFNNSLWLSAMGYYLVNMADVATSDSDRVRDFFNGFVRGRGALPSIRSGIQPYGILPASVYSRMAWAEDPDADIYVRIRDYANTLSVNWTSAVDGLVAASASGNNSQIALGALARTAVSTNYVQRIGLGSNLVWNYLIYSQQPDSQQPQAWYQQQNARIHHLRNSTGIPFSPNARISGMSFLQDHSNVSSPLVAPPEFDRNAPLPGSGGEGGNYLNLLSQATYAELRDENYHRFGAGIGAPMDAMLYKFARHTLLLEYHDAACKLLNLPEAARKDPELVNMPVGHEGNIETGPPDSQMQLSAGGSRWATLETPFNGFHSVAEFIDAKGAGILDMSEEPIYLFDVKESLGVLSTRYVGDLELLSGELVDTVCYRLDTWRLALVNQRLNIIRGITEGSGSRQQGIFLGAYGWVENVRKRDRFPVSTSPGPEFPLPLEYDRPNEGYFHAPSINQAAAAAVLRSGYATRGNTSNGATLSVNLASERIRYSLDILEGLKNGQSLSVLLGYAFERYMYERATYPAGTIIDPVIDDLRVGFALPVNVMNYTAPTPTTPNQAENVLDGLQLINEYQAASGNVYTTLTNAGIDYSTYHASYFTAIAGGIDWMLNLTDAVSDVSTAEGVFQLVQGNQAKSGAIADAIAKGNNIPEIDVINTPRTGTAVTQRFTLHVESNPAMAADWSAASVPMTPRANAEPYLNRWVGQLLGDPASIQCAFTTSTTVLNAATVSVADLELQPIDLLYIIGDEINNDESELARRVRRYIRSKNYTVGSLSNQHIGRDEVIDVNFRLDPNKAPNIISFEEMIALLKTIRDLITSSRSLRTADYIPPVEALGVVNNYDNNDYYTTRLAARYTDFGTKVSTLSTELANVLVTIPTPSLANLKDRLQDLSEYGLDETVYEYYFDETTADLAILKQRAAAVLAEANARIAAYDKIFPAIPSVPATGDDGFIARCLQGYQALFGRAFVALPKFELRSADVTALNGQLSADPATTVLSSNAGNPYIMDEWLCGVSKVRKNTANFEFMSVLASGVNLDAFTDDRTLFPVQLPYDPATDQWLGAKVPAGAVQDGRVAFAISVPGAANAYSMGSYEVGLMVDEWVDVIPNKTETTGIAFHANQPNQKPPQCLLLGLTPRLTGRWNWNDIVDMVNETFDLAKTRAVTYDMISGSGVGQLSPTFVMPFTASNATIGLTASI